MKLYKFPKDNINHKSKINHITNMPKLKPMDYNDKYHTLDAIKYE